MAKKAWKDLEGQFFRIDVGSTQAEALASKESNVLYITTEQSMVMNGEMVGTVDKKNENGDIRLMVSSDVIGTILINGEERAVDGYGLYTFRDVNSISVKSASVNRAITGADFSKWHPVNLTSLKKAFNGLSVRELDLSHIDVSHVTDMSQTFVVLKKLENLDVSTWDTRNVTTLDNTFNSLPMLKELDLRSFCLKSLEDKGNKILIGLNTNVIEKLRLGPNFFNAPKLSSIYLSCKNWIDEDTIKESLYTNLFDRKSAGQSKLDLYFHENTCKMISGSMFMDRFNSYGYGKIGTFNGIGS